MYVALVKSLIIIMYHKEFFLFAVAPVKIIKLQNFLTHAMVSRLKAIILSVNIVSECRWVESVLSFSLIVRFLPPALKFAPKMGGGREQKTGMMQLGLPNSATKD